MGVFWGEQPRTVVLGKLGQATAEFESGSGEGPWDLGGGEAEM